jgi:hypothetical protein
MAKKAKDTVVVLRGNAEEVVESDETTPDIDELRAIAEMEGGGDIKWTVFRTSDVGNKKSGYCGTLSTGDVSFQKIAEEWGVGNYRIRGTRSNGQFVKQQSVTISEEPKRPVQTLMPAGPANSIQDLLAIMDARDEKSSEKMLKWAAILSPILAPLLQNLFSQKGTTLTELTTALANVKALDGGGKVDQMEEFTKLLSLVKEVQGDGGQVAGSNWVDVVRDGIQGLPHIVAGVAAAAKGQALPQNPQLTQAAPIKEVDPMANLMSWLKVQLEALTFQASMNKDPGLYAEVMLDNLPAGADIKQLNEYLSRADWWALLTAFSPGVQPYPQWFAECREELLKGLNSLLNPPQAMTAPQVVSKPKAAKP